MTLHDYFIPLGDTHFRASREKDPWTPARIEVHIRGRHVEVWAIKPNKRARPSCLSLNQADVPILIQALEAGLALLNQR